MKGFVKFIKNTRDQMNSILTPEKIASTPHLTFILGNESCDLDSVMSALAFAYCNSFINSVYCSNQKITIEKSNCYIPLLNVSRQDFTSRFDSHYLLKKWGVAPEELIYFEELLSYQKLLSDNQKVSFNSPNSGGSLINQNNLLYNQKLSENLDAVDNKEPYDNQKAMILDQNFDIFLVDHNSLAPSQSFLKSFIREIIDHHEDKVDCWVEPGQKIRKNIRLAGSCCVLVAERILNDAIEILDEELAFGLYLTIMVDTYNFDPKFKNNRWVEKDWEVFLELKKILQEKSNCYLTILTVTLDGNPEKYQADRIYKEINGLKYDEELNLGLSLMNLLIKDSKVFSYSYGKIQISAVLVSPQAFFKKFNASDIEKAIFSEIESNQLKFYIIMFVYPDNKNETIILREASIFAKDHNILKQFKEGLKNLNFSEVDSLSENSKHFIDVDSVYSRKLIEPIISKMNFI